MGQGFRQLLSCLIEVQSQLHLVRVPGISYSWHVQHIRGANRVRGKGHTGGKCIHTCVPDSKIQIRDMQAARDEGMQVMESESRVKGDR